MKKNDVIQNIHNIIGRLVTAETEAAKSELAQDLKNALAYPPAVLSCIYIDTSHPLKKEALIIVDAFESVTNGMANSHVLDELSVISDDSPFWSWKLLIQAIQALYRSDFDASAKLSAAIDEESPVALLIPFFNHICAEELPEDPQLLKLTHKLWDRDALIDSAIHQLKDAVENELEDLFTDTGLLFLKHIAGEYPDTAKRLGLWLVKNGGDAGFDITPIVNYIQGVFGLQEGYRLIGCGLMESDPEVALFFFLKSLTHLIHDSSKPDGYVREFVSICSELLIKVESIEEELNLDIQYWKSIENLLGSISVEIRRRRACEIGYGNEIARSGWLNMKGSVPPEPGMQSPSPVNRIRCEKPLKEAVQLELFS